jgi:hypothetical protein
MRKLSATICLCLLLLVSFAAEAPALDIQVAPSTINKQSCGGSFSIHTDIPYGLSIGEEPGVLVSVLVNGLDLSCGKKPDSCGNLVLKADLDTVKKMVAPPSATVTVTADFVVTGVSEVASETIRVVDVSGRR